MRLFLLYAISGGVALGYQVIWFRSFVDRFGSAGATFLLVTCGFVGGLGAGALASRRACAWAGARTGLRNPLRLYGAIELLVAAAAALTFALRWIPGDLWGAFPYALRDGVHEPVLASQAARVALAGACVFAPCFLMGTAFPLLCSAFPGSPRFPAALYAWNTLGACAGILAVEFLLLPRLGHTRSLGLLLLLTAAIGAVFLLRPGAAPAAGDPSPPAPAGERRSRSPASGPLAAAAAVSGLLAGALEADALRRLWLLECTSGATLPLISLWAIAGIFLASVAVGALPRLRYAWLRAAPLAAFGAYALAWRYAYPLRDWIRAERIERFAAAASAAGPAGAPGGAEFPYFHFRSSPADLLLFTGIFVLPACALVSLVLPKVCLRLHARGEHLGLAYGLNTLGFCAGILLFGWLAPKVSVFYSLKLFLAAFAALALAMLALREEAPRAARGALAAGALALGAAAAAVPRGFDPALLGPGHPAARYPVRALRADASHTTYVVADPAGDRLYFDGLSMSGTAAADQRYMRLMAHVPLLAHPAPRRALVIGFGVGNTVSAVAAHDCIRAIDVVDLTRSVFETAPEFAATHGGVQLDPRVTLIHDDGRRFLQATDRRYDLVTTEPPPPMDAGVFRLYSREFYRDAVARLAPGGFVTQWLPILEMPREAVARVAATFLRELPHAAIFVGSGRHFVLVGSTAPLDLAVLERRFAESARVREDLRRIEVGEPLDLLARFVMGDRAMRRAWGGAPTVSDQGNALSHLYLDPLRPAVIPYDPVALYEELGLARLAAAEELRRTTHDLARLKAAVTDFPPESLAGVTRAEVAHARVDWFAVERLNVAATRAAESARWEECAAACGASLALCAAQPGMRAMLADALAGGERWEEALAAWRDYRELAGADGRSEYGLALALLRLGREAEALPHLRRAVERVPGGRVGERDAAEVLGALDSLSAVDRPRPTP